MKKKNHSILTWTGPCSPWTRTAYRGYFKLLAQKGWPPRYDPAALVDNIWAGTAAMVGNDGKRTNRGRPSGTDSPPCMGSRSGGHPLFDAFYRLEFQQAKAFCGFTPKSPGRSGGLQAAGHQVALAAIPSSGGGHGEPHPLGGAGPRDLCMVHHLWEHRLLQAQP